MITQAVVLKSKGKSKEAFEIKEVELPSLNSDQILIKN
jgi:NADPH:quinone reductase-like Zn-dependent oxidoreductase